MQVLTLLTIRVKKKNTHNIRFIAFIEINLILILWYSQFLNLYIQFWFSACVMGISHCIQWKLTKLQSSWLLQYFHNVACSHFKANSADVN